MPHIRYGYYYNSWCPKCKEYIQLWVETRKGASQLQCPRCSGWNLIWGKCKSMLKGSLNARAYDVGSLRVR